MVNDEKERDVSETASNELAAGVKVASAILKESGIWQIKESWPYFYSRQASVCILSHDPPVHV